MRDRSSAIALVVILAVCCLGAYVAVSGFLNGRPPSLLPTLAARPGDSTLVAVATDVIPTVSHAESTATITAAATTTSLPATPPLGFFQTFTASTPVNTPGTTLSPTRSLPTLPPTASAPPQGGSIQSCSAFPFCPKGGPPDSQLAPTGDPCPRNYIWGRILDLSGKGITDMRVRFKGPLGNTDVVVSKAPPDPPGIYNILSPPPGGSWVLWLVDASGKALSPQITLIAPRPYSGSGNCPNRVDFIQQR